QPPVDDGYELVRHVWRIRLGGGVTEAAFEKFWRRALHDWVASHAAFAKAPQAPGVDFNKVAAEVAKLELRPAPGEQSLDVVFAPSMTYDGRLANNGWLQELPQVGTRVVWDNPALVSPQTAEKLGLLPESYTQADPDTMYTQRYPAGKVATLTIASRT